MSGKMVRRWGGEAVVKGRRGGRRRRPAVTVVMLRDGSISVAGATEDVKAWVWTEYVKAAKRG